MKLGKRISFIFKWKFNLKQSVRYAVSSQFCKFKEICKYFLDHEFWSNNEYKYSNLKTIKVIQVHWILEILRQKLMNSWNQLKTLEKVAMK